MFEQSRGHGCTPDHEGRVTVREEESDGRLSYRKPETWRFQTETLKAQKAMRNANSTRAM